MRKGDIINRQDAREIYDKRINALYSLVEIEGITFSPAEILRCMRPDIYTHKMLHYVKDQLQYRVLFF